MKTYFFSILLTFAFSSMVGSAGPAIRPNDRIAIVGNTFADQLRVHGYLETLLLQNSGSEASISIRNLGWGGDMLTARDRPTNFPTEESTLTEHKTDVIVACFGMGESFAGEEGLADFRSDLKAFVKTHHKKSYNGKSAVRLVIVSPIAYEDLGALTPNEEARNRQLKSYTAAMREVSAEAGLPFVDLYEPSRYLMEEATGPKLTTNGIHLNEYGYWAVSRIFSDQLTATAEPWRLEIDFESKAVEGRGVEISALEIGESGMEFQVEENSPPTPAPPVEGPLQPQLEEARDRMMVRNLPAGSYRLVIDGTSVVEASHGEWARGVAIDSSPAHAEAQELRKAINDKNQQFTYSWKALNQVHIVGERKTSPSGRALPAEIIEFSKLANQRDKALRTKIELKTRTWQVLPVSE
ncbi:MAG: SGNH/GDSL hydrolase family protein [Verrucomicrobiales bacterium]|nr:SGNH/GDSL hydrolase family protein [Verrucomicrobiales bacterium]